MTSKFLLSGSGGQGVITMAILLAQAAALSRMGDPVQLSRHFREQWLCHIRTPRYVISRLWLGCLATGLFYLILLFPLSALGLMPYDFVPGLSSVARMLLAHPHVMAVRVSTEKPDVYEDCESIGVEIFRFREDL